MMDFEKARVLRDQGMSFRKIEKQLGVGEFKIDDCFQKSMK